MTTTNGRPYTFQFELALQICEKVNNQKDFKK